MFLLLGRPRPLVDPLAVGGVVVGGVSLAHGAGEGGGEVEVEVDDVGDVVVELADEGDVVAEAAGVAGLLVLPDLLDQHPVLLHDPRVYCSLLFYPLSRLTSSR